MYESRTPCSIYPAQNGVIYVGFARDGFALEAWGMQLELCISELAQSDIDEARRRWFLRQSPVPALPRPPQKVNAR